MAGTEVLIRGTSMSNTGGSGHTHSWQPRRAPRFKIKPHMTSDYMTGHLPSHTPIGHSSRAQPRWLHLAVFCVWHQGATRTMACCPVGGGGACAATSPTPWQNCCLLHQETFRSSSNIPSHSRRIFLKPVNMVIWQPKLFCRWSLKYKIWYSTHASFEFFKNNLNQMFMKLTPQQGIDFENQDHKWMWCR